ncbi:UDP-glycosyltransferase [Quillaja saponaria]|uniref:UDP-glycosyltransferase n=1 Tax=Quillaja saponaria TaxID=32244 RepID=A0AAD7PXM2_QUISA|nr:UDP-glycosyltransferase [Quillaja saponaria]
MPGKVEELIEQINGLENGKITCVLADQSIGWALDIAEKKGIRQAAFCPAAAAQLVLGLSIAKLIDKGIIDRDGSPVEKQIIQLSPTMPPTSTEHLVWACVGNLTTQIYFRTYVIYVAFGSFMAFEPTKFKELTFGLELSNRPFLWVVQPDITDRIKTYHSGFTERVANHAKIVGWAPQQKILSHPSVACFISHCGWNSTIEGTSNGIPFLCWPHFADQFLNQSYICDVWKVGLRLDADENGTIRSCEINNKIEKLLNDEDLKARSIGFQGEGFK